VLAVSGGPDSVALLDILAELSPELLLEPVVAHADHGIHERSFEVASEVERLARARYGLETVVGRLSLGPGASETRARIARYRFLRRVQAERGARFLVTAHHADDQVETVLLRLLKGTGTAGLSGIPARGPGGLVRPLLALRREEIMAHVAARGLTYHVDPANSDRRHIRSWLRGELLPLITSRLGEAGTRALLRTAAFAREEALAWDRALDALPALDLKAQGGRVDVARQALREYDKVLAGRVLRAAARRGGMRLLPLQAARVVALAAGEGSGRRLTLGEGLLAEVAFDRLVLRREAEPPATLTAGDSSGEAGFGCFWIRWRPEAAPAVLERRSWSTWLAPGGFEVRCPRPGDRIAPLRGVGRKRVVRVLMEARVPRYERAIWPVVVRGEEVVWLPGACRANRAVPEPGSLAVRIDVEPG
jgi:tRNA(Ile)-lysidine synthetase-like protein